MSEYSDGYFIIYEQLQRIGARDGILLCMIRSYPDLAVDMFYVPLIRHNIYLLETLQLQSTVTLVDHMKWFNPIVVSAVLMSRDRAVFQLLSSSPRLLSSTESDIWPGENWPKGVVSQAKLCCVVLCCVVLCCSVKRIMIK